MSLEKSGLTRVARWLIGYFSSSIGKKQTLGVAGVGLVGFLGGHMLGNLQLLKLDQVAVQASYNAYCQFLTGMKPLIWIVEAGLVGILLMHAGLALVLKFGNRRARGNQRYAVTAHKGDATPASYTMFASGVVVLVFLVQHLMGLKFGSYYLYENAAGEIVRDMWLTTILTFANPVWTAVYVVALLVAGAHLVHALPSLFRTFGIVHARWTPIFNLFGVLTAVALLGGYIVTAAGACWLGNRAETKALIQKSLDNQTQLEQKAKIAEGVRK